MTTTQTPSVEGTTAIEEIPQLAPGLPLTRERVQSVIDNFPEVFTLDDLVDRLIFLSKIDEGIAQADRGETIPHEEVMARARKRLARLRK